MGSSLDSNNLVQPEVMFYFDVYETNGVCLKGLSGRGKVVFRMSLMLLTLKTEAISIAQNLNTLFPIKRLKRI